MLTLLVQLQVWADTLTYFHFTPQPCSSKPNTLHLVTFPYGHALSCRVPDLREAVIDWWLTPGDWELAITKNSWAQRRILRSSVSAILNLSSVKSDLIFHIFSLRKMFRSNLDGPKRIEFYSELDQWARLRGWLKSLAISAAPTLDQHIHLEILFILHSCTPSS